MFKILDGPNKGKVMTMKFNVIVTGIEILVADYHKKVKDLTVYGQDADFGLIARVNGKPVPVKLIKISK